MIKKIKIIFTVCILSFAFNCYAAELAVLYTGDTHAALYPCHCPVEPDGGISRRATLIDKLRKAAPGTLLLDSGGFFAGGIFDEDAQNAELDKQRTDVQLKAMDLMHYDAALVSVDELNYGPEFLKQRAAEAKFAFISCDVILEGVVPFIIKDVSGIKVGITGATGISAQQKTAGIKYVDPVAAVKATVGELKNRHADIIILLSGLPENDNLRLANEVPGIDAIISNRSAAAKEKKAEYGRVVMLKPVRQARKLSKASFTLKGRSIDGYKVEHLRLSPEIADNPAVSAIRPACFSDYDCRKKGMAGVCQNPGSAKAACRFSEPAKVRLTVVVPKACRVCDITDTVNYLKSRFPGLEVSRVYYPSAEADKLIKACQAKALPLYIFGKEIESQVVFQGQFKNILENKGDFYMIKPAYTGVSYLWGRQPVRGKIDLFISLFGKNAKESLNAAKQFDPAVHFLVSEKNGAFTAARGRPEIEESLRSVCVKKYYPASFIDYLGCRLGAIDSSWWQDCAAGMDAAEITACARGEEGSRLLRENISLNQDAQVTMGPSYLMDNIEIFEIEGVPTSEDLKKVIKK